MPENTFDIVSKIDLAEVSNAVQQALKEIHQRFDLKDSKSDIQLNEKDNKLVLASAGRIQVESRHRRAATEAGEAQRAAEGFDLRPDYARRGFQRSPGDHAAAGHRDRKGARDRESDQGQQEESAGLHPRRFGARLRQRSRHAAGSHRAAARQATSASTCSSPTTAPTKPVPK